MSEFLEQFLIESRELVEQATDDLLALEETPSRERLDSAFRAFHTLKGAAGIMDFDAMGRALHAAEEALSSARSEERALTPAIVSDCLRCLDQIVQWLDHMEASGGEIPPDAEAAAEAVLRRFTIVPDAPTRSAEWAEALASRHRGLLVEGSVALRYRARTDSFFDGLDPLALFRDLPGLRALELSPCAPWPPLESFAVFEANLGIEALFDNAGSAPTEALREAGGDLDIVRLDRPPGAPSDSFAAAAAGLLAAQIALLDAVGADGRAGTVAAAVRAAVNVLRSTGRQDDAQSFERLAQSGLEPPRLARALEEVHAGRLDPRPIEGAMSPSGPPGGAALDVAAPEAVARSLRVDVERIDALVNLTGELTVAKNALAHATSLAVAGASSPEMAAVLKGQTAQLDRLVRELQRSVLQMRVLPMRHVFQRFPRLVREMVLALDKPARLITEGDATEADKAVVESLFEPLLHALRNALDHGVEPADVRAKAGKPPSATVVLRARSDGDQIIVEAEDDGGGVDVERVRAIAAERGMAAPETLAAMEDEDVIGLIFAPGFSTAAAVTSVSGRGVGMDAVRAGVERLGGRVTIESTRGAGTIVRFTLPFTVMMSRVMTVEAGGQVFGIPMESILETVRIPASDLVPLGTGLAFVLRDRTVAMLDLAGVLGRPRERPISEDERSIVVATYAGAIGGLEVDGFGGSMDIMLKPLEGLLAGVRGIAGATLLGDGRVLLVLDLKELLV